MLDVASEEGEETQASSAGEAPTLDDDNFGNRAVDVTEDVDQPFSEPIPIDTTAELLGRAKPKRPRTRPSSAAPAARGARKTAGARKPATRRTTKRKTESGDS